MFHKMIYKNYQSRPIVKRNKNLYNVFMKKYSQCTKKNIVIYHSGKGISEIDDLIFDPSNGKLKAIITKNNQILYFSDIIEWKIKVYIHSELLIKEIDDCKDIQKILSTNISIMGNKVINENNIVLGICEDILFCEKTGIITQFQVKKYFAMIIPQRVFLISYFDVIEIKEDHILVKGNYVNDVVPQE